MPAVTTIVLLMEFEYRIAEQSYNDPDFWYEHGGKGLTLAEAKDRLEYMQGFYGKYGRVFRIERKPTGAWLPYDPANL